MGKNDHPELFLEECKYVVKEKMIVKYIINNIEIYSDSDRKNFDEEDSGKENSNEENSDEENSDEENSDEKKKNTHTIKLIFKTYKKADKIYFNNVFSIYKNVNRILSKTTNFQRRLVEYIYNYSAM